MESTRAKFENCCNKLDSLCSDYCEPDILTKTLVQVKCNAYLQSTQEEEDTMQLARDLRRVEWRHANAVDILAAQDYFSMLHELVTTYSGDDESDSDDEEENRVVKYTNALEAVHANLQRPLLEKLDTILTRVPKTALSKPLLEGAFTNAHSLALHYVSQMKECIQKLMDSFIIVCAATQAGLTILARPQ